MSKKIERKIKLEIQAGKATPAPPIGSMLGQHGINIGQFCKEFNDKTKQGNDIKRVEIIIYEDKSYDFKIKTTPTAILLKKAAGIDKGSKTSGKQEANKITEKQIQEIAYQKMPDLNTNNLENAIRIIKGTAKSMGIGVVKED
ncbi:MAG: 50S ribosomal protein L11 [Methanosarcinales archaeon]|nr:50S ribosomal protein L11 [Methanosarcinales archaeon]